MSTPNAKYWHSLNLIISYGLWRCLPLLPNLEGPSSFFRLTENQLLEAGLDPSLTNSIIAGRNRIDPDAEWEKLQILGINTVSWDDPGYPKQLSEIATPPPLLYVRGNSSILNQPGLAVVGTRKISSYGKQATHALVPGLVSIGLNIISGMAIGTDSVALETCLENGGTPIAVIASGIDDAGITPKSNIGLARNIINAGCLISEIPPGTNVRKGNFPQRNRIISGLSLGALVIEADKNSGSLITANYALDQNREIFSVPGPIFSQNSSGTLSLIKRGAVCVTEVSDITKAFGWDIKIKPKQLKLADPLHQIIVQYISQEPASTESVIKYTKKSAGEILAALTELELIGILKQVTPGIYAKIK